MTLRNLIKDLEKDEINKVISLNALLYSLKFNYFHRSADNSSGKSSENFMIYDSLEINYSIKYALSLFLSNYAIGK